MTSTVTRISEGAYSVDQDGRIELVYVAGPPGDRWAFWKGRVFRVRAGGPGEAGGGSSQASRASRVDLPLYTASMPAMVLQILVQLGDRVSKGDTLLILEAMKMELPLRAMEAGVVTAIHCREGELVQPDTPLVEIQTEI